MAIHWQWVERMGREGDASDIIQQLALAQMKQRTVRSVLLHEKKTELLQILN